MKIFWLTFFEWYDCIEISEYTKTVTIVSSWHEKLRLDREEYLTLDELLNMYKEATDEDIIKELKIAIKMSCGNATYEEEDWLREI